MKISSRELCKRLKALDYHGEARYILFENAKGYHEYTTFKEYERDPKDLVPIALAPFLEEVCEWLRDKHNIHIFVRYRHTMARINHPWTYQIQVIGAYTMYAGRDYYDTYDNALENAIQHALDIIEEKSE